MKNLDVLICKRNSFLSKAIRFVTKGNWSHTALYCEVWGQPSIIEAQANGVNFKLYDTWRDKWGYDYVVFRKNVIDSEKELVLKAFSECGETKYDWYTFVGRIFGSRKKRNYEKEAEKMICSEFTGWVFDLPNWYQMTPIEQFNYLSNNNDWELINIR